MFTSASFLAGIVRGDCAILSQNVPGIDAPGSLVLALSILRYLLLCCGKKLEILCYINSFSKQLLEKEGRSIFPFVLGVE